MLEKQARVVESFSSREAHGIQAGFLQDTVGMSGLSGENDSVVVLDLLGSHPLRFF